MAPCSLIKASDILTFCKLLEYAQDWKHLRIYYNSFNQSSPFNAQIFIVTHPFITYMEKRKKNSRVESLYICINHWRA